MMRKKSGSDDSSKGKRSGPAAGGKGRSWDGPRSSAPPSGDGERPPRRTYRREGAVGGWNSRPPREGGGREGGAPREGGFRGGSSSRAPVAVPTRTPVPARKLQDGVRSANKALAELMEEFGSGIQGDYDISSLEATVSFDSDGRFLGFGEGGSASLKITLTPLDAESVFERDDIAMAGGVEDLDELEATGDDDDDLDDDDDKDLSDAD